MAELANFNGAGLAAAFLLSLPAPAAAQSETLLERVRAEPKLAEFAQLIERAGLDDTLTNAERATVFAPVDAAFADLSDGASQWIESAEKPELRAVLLTHIVSGRSYASSKFPEEMATGAGTLTAEFTNGRLVLGGEAQVQQGDLQASNGVLHLVDAFLVDVPEEPANPEPSDDKLQALVSAFTERQEGTATDPARSAEDETSSEFLTEIPGPDDGSDDGSSDETADGRTEREEGASAQSSGKPLKADALRGMRITTQEEKRSGRIVGVILSPETGRIEGVLAEFGGFFGLFGKTVELPWSRLEVARGRPLVVASFTADEISQREAVDPDNY